MKHHKTVTHETHVAPEPDLYKLNSKPFEPLQRKGQEFYGTKDYNKQAAFELRPHHAHANIYNHSDKPNNQEAAGSHFERKKDFLHTHWTEQPGQEHELNQRERVHQLSSNVSWMNADTEARPNNKDRQVNTF